MNNLIFLLITVLLSCNPNVEFNKTTGKVIDIYPSLNSSGSRTKIEYEVDGKTYTHISVYFMTQTIGDEYHVRYKVGKPKKSEVLLFEPLISDKDDTDTTSAVISWISRSKKRPSMTFQYKVGEKEYERIQHLPKIGKSYRNIYSLGDVVEIKYLKRYPQRSILLKEQE